MARYGFSIYQEFLPLDSNNGKKIYYGACGWCHRVKCLCEFKEENGRRIRIVPPCSIFYNGDRCVRPTEIKRDKYMGGGRCKTNPKHVKGKQVKFYRDTEQAQ